ncbi:hypothetical protein [Vibrio cholerae]|uniref:hypothetical protein n=1 Tax=Vibrio cholerae TaxID=666 RepID=UPI0022715C45|nr:hypothetical protein [Vibrio cholerae]MCX9579807.1 hypothetical protein [Vibrio cholerae]
MSNTDKKLRELAKRHAELSSDIKTSSEQRNLELSYCKGAKDEDGKYYESCYEMVYSMTGESMEHREGISFDEMLFNYGCRHCNSARTLKHHIGKLKQERGRIHSVITQIGKTL